MVSEWKSGLPETVCGKGSKLSETTVIREVLPKIIFDYNITTIADVGCGDQNWLGQSGFLKERCIGQEQTIFNTLYGRLYDGYDISPILSNITKFDVVTQVLPKAYDLVLCIYVLNHLYQPGEIEKAVTNLQKSGSKYLLATFNNYDGFPLKELELFYHKTKRSGFIEKDWYYGIFRL